jgi:hypothetical protein
MQSGIGRPPKETLPDSISCSPTKNHALGVERADWKNGEIAVGVRKLLRGTSLLLESECIDGVNYKIEVWVESNRL